MILEVTFLEFLLNCLRCKNCEYTTIFVLFYPCDPVTTTIIDPNPLQFWYQKLSYICVRTSAKLTILEHEIVILYATPQCIGGNFGTKQTKHLSVLGQLSEDFVVVKCSFEGYSVLFPEPIVILIMRVIDRRMKYGF
jgi:predicted nucleic-acid-binding Zn-ribbon protein